MSLGQFSLVSLILLVFVNEGSGTSTTWRLGQSSQTDSSPLRPLRFVIALNNVDFPTFGKPTIPAVKGHLSHSFFICFLRQQKSSPFHLLSRIPVLALGTIWPQWSHLIRMSIPIRMISQEFVCMHAAFSFPHDRVIDTLFLLSYRLLFNRLIRFLILLKYVLNPFEKGVSNLDFPRSPFRRFARLFQIYP